MTKEEALEIAQKHIEKTNQYKPLLPNYEYIVSEPYEYEEYWYFDFKFKPKPNIQVDPNMGFGGAPGYLILKQTGEVETIAFWQLQELGKRDKELKRILQLVKEFINTPELNSKLREAFNLTSAEALALKRRLEDSSLSDQDKKWILLQELIKQKKDK